jgi:hypothetical protein
MSSCLYAWMYIRVCARRVAVVPLASDLGGNNSRIGQSIFVLRILYIIAGH